MNCKQWSFHVTAPDYQIDLLEIEKDLTPANPVAFVEINGDKKWQGWVIIHESVISKANLLCDLTGELFGKGYYNFCNRNEVSHPKEFDEWADWVKKVKKAPWPESVRNKGTVTVTLKRL